MIFEQSAEIFLKQNIMIIFFFIKFVQMRKRKLVEIKTNMSEVGSSSSAFNEHEQTMLPSVDHDKTSQAPSRDARLLGVSATHKADVPFERDVYTQKYITQWKP